MSTCFALSLPRCLRLPTTLLLSSSSLPTYLPTASTASDRTNITDSKRQLALEAPRLHLRHFDADVCDRQTRTTKKAKTDALASGPRRLLTAYNIFLSRERQLVICVFRKSEFKSFDFEALLHSWDLLCACMRAESSFAVCKRSLVHTPASFIHTVLLRGMQSE